MNINQLLPLDAMDKSPPGLHPSRPSWPPPCAGHRSLRQRPWPQAPGASNRNSMLATNHGNIVIGNITIIYVFYILCIIYIYIIMCIHIYIYTYVSMWYKCIYIYTNIYIYIYIYIYLCPVEVAMQHLAIKTSEVTISVRKRKEVWREYNNEGLL